MSTATLKKLALTAVGSALIGLGTTGVAQAASISFEARGLDSGINSALTRNNFFGISFDDGPAGTFLESVTLDLSPDSNAFFDITSGLFSVGGIGFDFAAGSTSGLSAGDISRSLSGDNKKLTLSFASGTFAVGDSLRFGIDTDGVGPSIFGFDLLDPGFDFGIAGVIASAFLSNGTSGSATFNGVSLIAPSQSVAIVNIDDPEPVPEPASVLGLLAIGALGAGSSLKRKKKGNVGSITPSDS